MELRSPTSVAPTSPLVGLLKVAAFAIALVTLAALGLTVFTLVEAGPSAFAEFGVESLVASWPTAAALAILVWGPAVSVRLRTPPYVGLAFLTVWVLSAVAYLVSAGFSGSLRQIVAISIWSATPLLPVFTLRTILALRSSMRAATQISLVTAVALLFWWVTVPTAIAVTCALTGSCP